MNIGVIYLSIVVLLFIVTITNKFMKTSRLQSCMNSLIRDASSHESLIYNSIMPSEDLPKEYFDFIYNEYINFMKDWYASTNFRNNRGLYALSKEKHLYDFFKKSFYVYLRDLTTYPHRVPYHDELNHDKLTKAYRTLYDIVCRLLTPIN